MLKSKIKFSVLVLLIVALISTFCFATEAPVESEATEDISSAEVLSATNEEAVTTIGAEEQATEEEKFIENDLYLVGDKVTVDKIVDGNVFIMANEVTINSEIGGDVYVLAQKVTIDGAYIYCSLYAAAQEITINGVVCDAYIAGDNFTLAENGYVYRDLKVAANTVTINGKVRRDVYATANTYKFSEETTSLIGGDFNYSAKTEISIAEGVVLGDVNFKAEEVKVESVGEKVLGYVSDVISNLAYIVVVILLAVWLAPKFVEKVTSMDTKKAFTSLGIGILAPIVISIVLFVLLFSVIGAKIGIVATMLFIVACMSGTAVASIYFGKIFAKLVKWETKPKFVLACGIAALIIWAVSKVPFIGGLVGCLVAVFGLGALILNIFPKKEKASKEVTDAE